MLQRVKSQRLVQSVQGNIHRTALPTVRLLVFSDSLNIKFLGCALVQPPDGGLGIFFGNQQFAPADKIGIKPVEPDQMVVRKDAV
jgi:hypothetical protein